MKVLSPHFLPRPPSRANNTAAIIGRISTSKSRVCGIPSRDDSGADSYYHHGSRDCGILSALASWEVEARNFLRPQHVYLEGETPDGFPWYSRKCSPDAPRSRLHFRGRGWEEGGAWCILGSVVQILCAPIALPGGLMHSGKCSPAAPRTRRHFRSPSVSLLVFSVGAVRQFRV